MVIQRRQALMNALFGAGSIGLRSLASGIPAAVLLNPHRALAQETPACDNKDKAQYVILTTSESAPPTNANVPGTYDDPAIIHPEQPEMAPKALTLAGKSSTAATPWASLPQAVLDRSCFFHHATRTGNHGNERKVMSLMGEIKRQEMLVSLIAAQMAPCLGTVQAEPVSLGANGPGEALVAKGRMQPLMSPRSLAELLTSPKGPLTQIQTLRDNDLNRLNAIYGTGTRAQKAFLDRYATSQTQARSISQDLLAAFSAIRTNDADSQIIAAIGLIRMNVTPVVSINIPFGGDNHGDNGLVRETQQTVQGVARIASLLDQLKKAGLQDKVTFVSLNVFGRTLLARDQGATRSGRGHNSEHHCTIMIGKGIRGGVVGGVEPKGNDYHALPIDSVSGRGGPGGDISFDEGLGAVGKTLATAVGVNAAVIEDQIETGKVVRAALA